MDKGFSVDLGRPIGFKEEEEDTVRNKDFCTNICALHDFTSYTMEDHENKKYERGLGLMIFFAFTMVNKEGLDPEKIMLEKHEYNKTRPYRHGGKVV